MSQLEDKPQLEVYPWYFVVLLSVFWGCLWFTLWAALRGTAAAAIVALSPIEHVSFYPWLVPLQLVVWLISLAWVYRDIRRDKNPPRLVFGLCILLLATFPATAFYMLGRVDRLTSMELSSSATSVFLQKGMQQKIPDILAVVLTLLIGGYTNLRLIRKKYVGIVPQKRRVIPVVWGVVLLVGISVGQAAGTMWAFLVMPALGNAFTVYCYRETIRLRIKDSVSTWRQMKK